MRVLMITSSRLPPREGIGTHVWQVAQRLGSLGHTVTIMSRGLGTRWHSWKEGKVSILSSPFFPCHPFHVNLEGMLRNSFIRSRRGQWDIIHAHSPLVVSPPLICPTVVTVHTPLVVDAHHVQENVGWGGVMKWFGLTWGALIERRLVNRSVAIAIVNESVRPDLKHLGVNPQLAFTVGNGVDSDRFSPKPDCDKNEPTILFVGRLAPRKQALDAIRAMSYILRAGVPAQLHIVGEGPLRPAVEREVRRLGLSEVVYLHGFVPHNSPELPQLYRDALVLVQPSLYEGLPGSVLEAMASGLPVVASDIPAHRVIISPGETGSLVPPGRPDELAKALIRLLTDNQLRTRIGSAARQYVSERYSWKQVADATLNLYGEALALKNEYVVRVHSKRNHGGQ